MFKSDGFPVPPPLPNHGEIPRIAQISQNSRGVTEMIIVFEPERTKADSALVWET